ncbi:MAG: tyrosine-type recombinase/integrase [Flavobacteriales bacterium]|nr:tyrosine-type recombinase/integrase [Flavobacteriales bacterium]
MDPKNHEQWMALIERLQVTENFRPAQLTRGKEWVITYYVRHPQTGQMKRVREKVNRVRDLSARKAYAERRVRELNTILGLGWSPFSSKLAGHGNRPIHLATEDFIKAKERERIRKDSMRSYNSLVSILVSWCDKRKLKEMPVLDFTESRAREFMHESYVDRELSPRSFNNYHTFFVTLWNWFKEHGYVAYNVFEGIKKKRVDPDGSTRRPPTIEERKRIREYLQEHNPRFLTFCLLCFHCGIRPKELFMLKPSHFHIGECFIMIPGSVAKNHRTQGVAIPEVMMQDILALELGKQDPAHYVFSSKFEPGPRLCDSRDSGRAWTELRQAIGLSSDLTLYQLKHAGGEQLSRDGVGEVDLMNHLRHHDLSETSTYTRRTYQKGVRTVLKKASPF